jgi:hypothetical protein
MVQTGYQYIGWIQAALGITEAEAVYAFAEVYSILEPWYVLANAPPGPGGGVDGGYSGDEGTN